MVNFSIMRQLSIWLLLATLCFTAFLNATELGDRTSALKDILDDSLDALDIIAKGKKDGIEKIRNLNKWVGPLVGALANIADIILSFIIPEGESEELQYLKQEFKAVNNKLDALEYHFKDIKNLVTWSAVKNIYAKQELDIHHLEELLNNFIDSPQEIKDIMKQEFVHSFDNQYGDAGKDIFDGLIRTSLFGGNIVTEFRKFANNNRVKTLQFIYAVSQLLIRAMKLESAYFTLTQSDFLLKRSQDGWERRMNELADFIKKTDDDIMNGFESDYPPYITELIDRNQKLKGGDLAKFLYTKLKEQYGWRSWYVVLAEVKSDDEKDEDVFFVKNCGGYTRWAYKNHHFAINHGEPDDKLDKSAATTILNRVPAHVKYNQVRGKIGASAKYIFNKMNTDCDNNNRIIGVVELAEGFSAYMADDNIVTGETKITKPGSWGIVGDKTYTKFIAGP